MEMFEANRISTAETDTEYAAYCSNDTISSHFYTIILSMFPLILRPDQKVSISLL